MRGYGYDDTPQKLDLEGGMVTSALAAHLDRRSGVLQVRDFSREIDVVFILAHPMMDLPYVLSH